MACLNKRCKETSGILGTVRCSSSVYDVTGAWHNGASCVLVIVSMRAL